MVLESITRSKGIRPRRQATPAVPDLLRRLLAARPSAENPTGARDRAMLLLGFGAALRHSEVVALPSPTPPPSQDAACNCAFRRSRPAGPGRSGRGGRQPGRSRLLPAIASADWLRHRERCPDIAPVGGPSGADDRPLYGDAGGVDDDLLVATEAKSANATSASVALDSTLMAPKTANLRQLTISTTRYAVISFASPW